VNLGAPAVYSAIAGLIKRFPGFYPPQEQAHTDEELVELAARLMAEHGGFRYGELKVTGKEQLADITVLHYARDDVEDFAVTIRKIEGLPVVERRYRPLP